MALATAIFRQTVMTPKGNRDWQAVQVRLGRRHAWPLRSSPCRNLGGWLLEAEVARARADAEGRPADGVREAAAIYRNIKLDEKAQRSVLPSIAMAFDRLELHDDADRTIAAWEKTVAPEQVRMLAPFGRQPQEVR